MARKRAAKDSEVPPGPPMTDAERTELDARLGRMISKPNKADIGVNFFLIWTERDASDQTRVVMWHPETEDEIRSANLFHDAAHGLGDFARAVKKGRPVRRAAEEAALINAILQNRADDTGYLVYADYLTENGNAQGDFIRLCVEIERLPPDHPDREEKTHHREVLLAAHAEEWYAPLGRLGPRPDVFGTFAPWLWLSAVRGVIDEVVIDRPGLLPGSAARLFAAAPFLRKLEFAKGHLNPTGLAKVKQLEQIEELDLSCAELTSGDLTVLFRSKYLTNLKALNAANSEVSDADVTTLVSWPGLARLESLDVSNCDLQTEGVRALATSRHIANLVRLRIGRNRAGEALSLLLAAPHLKRLKELELGGMTLDLHAVACLSSAAFGPTLTHLDLDSATFTADAFQRFTQSPLPALRRLVLNNVDLRLPAASQLANAPFTSTLEELYLDNCRLGAASANFYYQGKFPNLRTLDVSRNRFGWYGIGMLTDRAKSFPALTNLRLWDNRLRARDRAPDEQQAAREPHRP